MSLTTITAQSAINVQGATTIELLGSDPIQTVSGISDGMTLTIYGAGNEISAGGNISAVSETLYAGYPRQFLCRNGTLYEIIPAPELAEVAQVDLFSEQITYADADAWGCPTLRFS